MKGNNVKKCLKCGGEMEKGDCLAGYAVSVKLQYVSKGKQLLEDNIIPLYCKQWGYLELYRAMKEKRE